MSTNVTETLQFNCTTCPSECLLTVEVERSADGAVVEVRSVTGNSCPRGDKFAHQELTPIRMGGVVLEDLLHTGIDLIASMDIDPA